VTARVSVATAATASATAAPGTPSRVSCGAARLASAGARADALLATARAEASTPGFGRDDQV
jgi:hypothetical protein